MVDKILAKELVSYSKSDKLLEWQRLKQQVRKELNHWLGVVNGTSCTSRLGCTRRSVLATSGDLF